MNDKHNWIIKPLYDDLGNTNLYRYDNLNFFDSKGFIVASKNGKYGLINEKEEIKIPFTFKSLKSFDKDENAIASIIDIVSNQEKFGVINRFGDWIIKPIYENIVSCSEDKIFDKKGYLLVKNNDKYGFIDTKNVVKIPFLFDDLSNFDSKGYAIAFTIRKTIEAPDLINMNVMCVSSINRCGIIDRKGNWVVPAIYDDITADSKMAIFDSKGFLKVRLGQNQGFVNRKGKLLTNFDDQSTCHNFVNNMKISFLFDSITDSNIINCGYGIIDRKRNWVVPPVYDEIENYDGFLVDNELCDSLGFLLVKKNNKWGFIDLKNEIKVPLVFDELTYFDIHHHSIARLKDSIYDSESKKYIEVYNSGIIDRKGKWVLKPEYEIILPYRDSIGVDNSFSDPKGYIMVRKNNKWGFLNKAFIVKVPLIFDKLYEFDNKDYACACINKDKSYYGKKCGFINRNGEWIIEPIFNELRPFNPIGFASAILNERQGYINRQGEFIFEPN
ncbi:MAG: WG repeat-containing protein [Candidatus Sericytochromatia bacterium]|nr:WG repeat-containing protein [Candidatus Sericytochromatia bacterium]